jgi:hypothetical protein
MASTDPNFFIIGGARCGTTALSEMIRAHPQAFVTVPKEPHFLAFAGRPVRFRGPGDDLTINRVAVSDPSAYKALYTEARHYPLRGEASVSTMYYSTDSTRNLARHFPDTKLVAILREPISRAYSSYSYQRVRGFEPCEDFLDALRLEPQRIADGWHHMWHYTNVGLYARQLTTFLEAVGPARLLVLFHDDLERDPNGVALKTFSFLGIDPYVSVEAARVNASGRFRAPILQRAALTVAVRPGVRRILRAVIPYQMRKRIREASVVPGKVPAHAAEVLRERFRADLEALSGLLRDAYPSTWERAPEWVPR